jgi:deoxyribodipyrimidine photo-lyase
MEKPRIKHLNDHEKRSGRFILYWVQASQRTLHNHALYHAVDLANTMNLPVVAYFGLKENYPEANERHFKFMLEGLEEVADSLKEMGIQLIIKKEEPWKGALKLSNEALVVICDKGYLRHQIEWRRKIALETQCKVIEVESDVIIPVETAADKEMYSAGTFRPRVHRLTDRYLIPPDHKNPKIDSFDFSFDSLEISEPSKILKRLDLDRSVAGVEHLSGGTSKAIKEFHFFISKKMDRYHLHRNDPSLGIQSNMAPYLHFGQISPITLALEANEVGSPGAESFLEELVVRRELAINFVNYNPLYDEIECLPVWARQTLNEHSNDIREYVYTSKELEEARTHDPYWNAAQNEMLLTGKMHNYMRMYWGKKILEWTEEPREAFKTALYLNNKYSIDGRDPNSYAGVAWCFGKHDRPWAERSIFGKVRYMNDKGLKRKFRIDDYVDKIAKLEDRLCTNTSY